MSGGLIGALVVLLAVVAGLKLARRCTAGLAKAGTILAVALVVLVALSVSGLVTR